MAYTINFENDFVAAEELQLLETKQAILEKLRAHFAETPNLRGRTAVQTAVTNQSASKRVEPPR